MIGNDLRRSESGPLVNILDLRAPRFVETNKKVHSICLYVYFASLYRIRLYNVGNGVLQSPFFRRSVCLRKKQLFCLYLVKHLLVEYIFSLFVCCLIFKFRQNNLNFDRNAFVVMCYLLTFCWVVYFLCSALDKEIMHRYMWLFQGYDLHTERHAWVRSTFYWACE